MRPTEEELRAAMARAFGIDPADVDLRGVQAAMREDEQLGADVERELAALRANAKRAAG